MDAPNELHADPDERAPAPEEAVAGDLSADDGTASTDPDSGAAGLTAEAEAPAPVTDGGDPPADEPEASAAGEGPAEDGGIDAAETEHAATGAETAEDADAEVDGPDASTAEAGPPDASDAAAATEASGDEESPGDSSSEGTPLIPEGIEEPAAPGTEEELSADPDAGSDASTMEAAADAEAEAPMSMMELLMEEGEYLPESHSRGDLVTGRILRKDENQLILDIGAKQEGMVPSSDLMRLPKDYLDGVEVGDEIEAVVLRPEGREGGVLVSISQALALADWKKAHDLMESGEILELEVVGHNKGGGLVGFGNLQGFVPRSHLVRLASVNDADAVMRGLTDMVGETLAVKVIEVSRRKRRLIMSERLALREWRSDRKKRLLEELHEGDIRRGRVSSIADFGVFVDLGGADGLVHVSELTHERGRHPKDVVSVGQEVDVYVLSIDRERQRIGLSMRRLQADPWETVEEDHYVGELVEVVISNLAKFGAFARLDDGIEGLIHISELSDGHVEHPRDAVRPGQTVTVEIIAIEPHRQRVGLSIRRVPKHLRHVEEEPEQAAGESEVVSAGADAAEDVSSSAEPAEQEPMETVGPAGDQEELVEPSAAEAEESAESGSAPDEAGGEEASESEAAPLAKVEAAPLAEIETAAAAEDETAAAAEGEAAADEAADEAAESVPDESGEADVDSNVDEGGADEAEAATEEDGSAPDGADAGLDESTDEDDEAESIENES